jgi:hypothetical protein
MPAELRQTSDYNGLGCQTSPNASSGPQRDFGALSNPDGTKKPIDPDAEKRRYQRMGNWIVVVAYGISGLMFIGGLLALAYCGKMQ